MSEDKYCPIVFTIMNKEMEIRDLICIKEKCAWYDDKNNQCILITIGRNK